MSNQREALEAWCSVDNDLYQPTDDSVSNRRDWVVWQADIASMKKQLLERDAVIEQMREALTIAERYLPAGNEHSKIKCALANCA